MRPWRAAACLLAARGGAGLSLQRAEDSADGHGPECPHESCRVSSVYQGHIERTRDVIASWEVRAAPANDTDRVAATIFQPETPEATELFSYAIRANMHRLGPEWALLVFYGSEAGREMLDEALGKPPGIIWRPIMLKGKRQDNITKQEANWFRLSMDFWGQVPTNLPHVLVFESDSLLLRGPGCVEEFFSALRGRAVEREQEVGQEDGLPAGRERRPQPAPPGGHGRGGPVGVQHEELGLRLRARRRTTRRSPAQRGGPRRGSRRTRTARWWRC
ncbi:unnamed protein product [Prorocentrum cordatum]|uniref:Hexosyltransferase n=1 Tax=Prorocentrum cordatum TaxID=2364126 RepID=A0ABN9SHR6_9DINO|nr:unnamed protein product [Polarella glacialis]